MKIKKDFNKFTAVFFVLIFPSPIFSALIWENFHLHFLLAVGLILSLAHIYTGTQKTIVYLSLTLALAGCVASILAQSLSQIGIFLIVIISLNVATIIRSSVIDHRTLSLMNQIVILVLVGAWVSLLYFSLGGTPVWLIHNPDGRPNLLFLSSFTNSGDYDFWGVIRPSGIYDEAGALSFALSLLVILNELHNPRNRISLPIMLLGLITMSLTHALLTAIYLIYFSRKIKFKIFYLLVVLLSSSYLFSTINPESKLSINFLNRFVIDEGRLLGDNRSGQVINFLDTALKDPDVSTRGHQTIKKEIGANRYDFDQSSNPFSIWYNYGAIAWLVYFSSMAYISYISIKNFRNPHIFISGVFLIIILLQRPYIHHPMWSIAVWVTILALSHACRTPKHLYALSSRN